MSTTYSDLIYTTFPDSEQSFVEMIDMTSSDGALMTQYQTAMQNGDFATARSVLTQIPNANNKILDSVKMNTLFDTTVALERFYKTNVEPYIETKQKEWEQLIQLFTANFGYVGPYSSGQSYQQNNIVSNVDSTTGDTYLYIALQNNSNPLTDTSSWRALTVRGITGYSGTGFLFMGLWSGTASYSVGNIVIDNNSLWEAIQPNINQQPSTTTGYWQQYGPFNSLNITVSSSQPTQMIGDFWFQVVN